jgi:predicted DNA-binding ribbon-helix-helix protein
MTMEDAFWDALKEIAVAQGTTIDQLIAVNASTRIFRRQPGYSCSTTTAAEMQP